VKILIEKEIKDINAMIVGPKSGKYWQAQIRIKQLPSFPPNFSNYYSNELNNELLRSWLVDPFSDHNTVYCMKLQMDENFEMTFYLTEQSEREAFIRGNTFLTFLEDLYPGLSGELSVRACPNKLFEKVAHIYELKFPILKGHPKYKFNLFQRMIALFKYINSTRTQFFIFWKTKRSDPLSPYLLKIFLRVDPTGEELNNKFSLYELLGKLNYINMGLRRNTHDYGEWIRREGGVWGKMMRNLVFKNEQITCKGLSTNFDFLFYPEIPLQHAYYLKNENISFIPTSNYDDKMISVGHYVKHGVVTNQYIYMPKEDFEHSVLIAGVPKTGKTTFLSHICYEFKEKAPEVGLLILNIGKECQEEKFPYDRIVHYGAPDCKIPYYVEGRYRSKCLQETADYLAGSLGFEEPLNKITLPVMTSFLSRDGHLPYKLSRLFRGITKWFEDHKYHIKYQTDILRAFDNRAKAIFSDSQLNNITRLDYEQPIPEWFKEWRAGKNIYIDLFPANIYSRRLLANAIFQMVRALTPKQEINVLRNLICIDEAHNLVANIKGNLSEEDIISRRQLGSIFRRLLQEFRGKGISFIIVDQTPSDLLDCVTKLPSLKFVFRVGKDDGERFTNNLEEREFLKALPNRNLLVLNGGRGERFVMRTIDR